MDRLGRRRILDQLDQLIAVHDLTRRQRQIAPRFERLRVGHLDAPGLQVAHQILHAIDQVLTTSFDGLVDHLGVGEQRIGRADRIQKLAHIELQLALFSAIEALNVGGRLEHAGS